MKKPLLVGLLTILCYAPCASAEEGWISLWDGKTFKGWKANENSKSWKIKDGAFVCKGPRSHLFYTGEAAPFENFHFKCEVMTKPRSNSGIYFHTKYQESGWPDAGYEAQVNNTHRDPRKTGSLYAVKDVMNKAPAKDNEWFTEEIIVQGKHIVIKVNGKTVVDYTEPKDVKGGRKLSKGTFAFQAHDPVSEVHFRKIMVKKLP